MITKQSNVEVTDTVLRLPADFPEVPDDVKERFPSMVTYSEDVNRWWRANQNVLNDYANAQQNVTQVGGVLQVDGANASMYIRPTRGTGAWANPETAFYVDNKGFFSLKNNLTWNPVTNTLTVQGTIIAVAGTIGGFDIGADYIRDTANSFGLSSTVTGGDDVRFWAGNTFANRSTAPFRVTESGLMWATGATITGSAVDGTSTIGGRIASVIAGTINSSGNVITDLINARINTSTKAMLSDFNFGATDYSGALKAGTITWNTTTGAITGGSGVLVYRGGIVGAAAGVGTFTIDAATGTATFAGTLSAPTGNIGGWTINASTLSKNNAILDSAGQLVLGTVNNVVYLSATDATYRVWVGNASAGSAAFSVTKAGVLSATGATISGSITATTGTIGGWTVGATTLSASNVIINSAGELALGTGNDILIASAANATYRLWIGNATAGSATFSVTKGGVMSATGATISGTITATGGTIGGFTISPTEISTSGVKITTAAGSGIIVTDGVNYSAVMDISTRTRFRIGYAPTLVNVSELGATAAMGSLLLAVNAGAIGFSAYGDGTVSAGAVTATTFSGSGASLTSLPAGNLTGTYAALSGANITTLNASNLASGTVGTARLGSGSATSATFLRGDQSWQGITSGNVSGLAASATTDTTNATNISSGTLNNARLPSAISVTTLAASSTSSFTGLVTTNAGSGANDALLINNAGKLHFWTAGNGTYIMENNGIQIWGDGSHPVQIKGTGVMLQFGTHTALGAETVTGFITVQDDGGTSRKLAVVS